MFSKTITNSGKFLKMPASSRLLYYDLGMNADDDGYAEWFTVMRMTGAAEQDLNVLKVNGFVQVFDENVLVILDWKENNYIRTDRYQPSKYLGHYEEISRLPVGIPNDNQRSTQVRVELGKERIGEGERHPPAQFSSTKKEDGTSNVQWLVQLSDGELTSIALDLGVSKTDVRETARNLYDHCQANGKQYQNYRARLCSWIREDIKSGKLTKAEAQRPSARVQVDERTGVARIIP